MDSALIISLDMFFSKLHFYRLTICHNVTSLLTHAPFYDDVDLAAGWVVFIKCSYGTVKLPSPIIPTQGIMSSCQTFYLFSLALTICIILKVVNRQLFKLCV